MVTADMVLDQVADYNCRCPGGKGHLYGAIVAAAHQYLERKQQGKYWRYELGFLAHYLADLSMPLHNVAYNEFNKLHHSANDGAAEPARYEPTDAKVARIAAGIREAMKRLAPYQLPPAGKDITGFDLQLAARIAEIANKATALGYSMQESQPQRPVMNQDEVYGQLAQSALLLKAVFSALQ